MITYTRSKNLHPCRLDKAALFELVDIVKRDFHSSNTEDDFRISTSFDGTNINENSLEKFLEHKNLPQIFSELSINQYDRSTDRTIGISHLQIRFNNYAVSLYVTGDSESMVKGKYSQVADFLRKKRPPFWFFRTPPLYIIQGAILAAIVAGLFVLCVRLYYKGFDTFGILLFIGLVLMSLFEYTMMKYPYTQINLKEKRSFIETHNTLIILSELVIGFFGLILTAVSVVLQVIQLYASK